MNEFEPSSNPLVQMSEMFDAVGHPMYSDEFLGRVLAWSCLSGFCEPTVTNAALNAVMMIAARRFGIQGGCVPEIDRLNKHWRPAMKELAEKGAKTPWLKSLMERYKITGWEKLNYREWLPEFKVAVRSDPEQINLL